MARRVLLTIALLSATGTPAPAQKPASPIRPPAVVRVPSGDELLQALDDENVALALALVKKGANPNAAKNSSTALGLAAGLGDLPLVKALLEREAKVNPAKKETIAPLDYALDGGHVAVAKLLVEKGARLNDGDGQHPLVAAAGLKDLGLVRLMLEKGADAKHVSEDGVTALSGAAETGLVPMMELLLAHGSPAESDPLLVLRAVRSGSVAAVRLLETRARALVAVADANPPMLYAASSGSDAMVRFVAEKGFSADVENADGVTALMIAASRHETEIVKTLLALRVRTDALSVDFDAALDLAQKEKAPKSAAAQKATIAALKAAGAKPAPASLARYAYQEDLEGLNRLLGQGASPNVLDARGRVPLYHALMAGGIGDPEKLVEALLKHGANPNAKAPDGRTLAEVAREEGNDTLLALLRRSGADAPEQELTEALLREPMDAAAVDAALAAGVVPESNALAAAILRRDRSLVVRLLDRGASLKKKVRLLSSGGLLDRVNAFNADFPLHVAAETGQVELVKLLLDRGADPNQHDGEDGRCALHCVGEGETTIEQNDAVVRLLIERGADVRARAGGLSSGPVLSHLAGCVSAATLTLLLDRGAAADVNPKGELDTAPLTPALSEGKVENVRILLERGADPNKGEDPERPPLIELASKGGDVTEATVIELAKLLVKHGATLNARDSQGRTPLQIAKEANRLELAKWLRASGGQQAISRETRMIRAILSGDQEEVRKIVKEGFSPDASLDSDTPLSLACLRGEIGIVKLLLQAGADINKRGSYATPLLHAASTGDPELVSYLLQRGAKVDAGGSLGTPLTEAIQYGHEEVVEVLLAAGADVNARKSERPGAPLAAALGRGTDEMLERLLKAKADPNLGAPLVVCVLLGNPERMERLRKAGAKIDQTDERGRTALMYAAEAGEKKAMIWLLKNKASVGLKDARGRTALDGALENHKSECAELLRKAGAAK